MMQKIFYTTTHMDVYTLREFKCSMFYNMHYFHTNPKVAGKVKQYIFQIVQ